jgi:site-specific recombinase XerD
MGDERTRESLEWINKWFQKHGHPKDDTPVLYDLGQAIGNYLLWMSDQGYSDKTIEGYKQMLNQFLRFIKKRRFCWDEIFTLDTLKWFQKVRALTWAHGVRGLSQYLFEQGKILEPIPKRKAPVELPDIYEQYLAYHKQNQQACARKIKAVRRVLAAFNDYLETSNIRLCRLRIEHVDAFLAEFNEGFLPATCKTYRGYLRGFLKYLYHECQIIKTDLAPLVVGAPMFARAKPPKFLRPHELEKLFANLKHSTATDLRFYAMVHLAYFLGLRPVEISKISLDDISFSRGELTLKERKNNNPVTLPLPEHTLTAIAAYMIGARVNSKHRSLFLSLRAPYRPISPGSVGQYITAFMRQVGLCGTAYWLRHTYAQNLLEAGASIYEIKEMMGHDSIESTRKYLSIHIRLMREVLFDETL